MSSEPAKETPQKKEDPNQKITKVWKDKGAEAAVKAMFEHPETKQKLTYSEMRMFYG